MAKAKGSPRFVAEVLIRHLVEMPLQAANLTDALSEAAKIRRDHVVDFNGDPVDGTIEITGVRDATSWDKAGL